MQYTFDLVETAALWAGADPFAIRKQMDRSDYQNVKSNYEYELHQAQQNWYNWTEWFRLRREICLQCAREPNCPEFTWANDKDGAEQAVLQCPQGWDEKPPEEELSPFYFGVGPMPRLRKRYMPSAGEFTDLPDYVQRIKWLKSALDAGELQGTKREITAHALREWIQAYFPGEKPAFLFPDSPKAPVSTPESLAITKYKLGGRKKPLDAEIKRAIDAALDPDDAQSVWDALTKLADEGMGCLVGQASEGIQYRGKQFEDAGHYDILSKKMLRDRLARKRKNEEM